MYFIRQFFNFNFNFNFRMSSIKVTCCSCFFDQCVWFSKQNNLDINFNKIQLSKSDIFIKEKRHHHIFDGPLLYIEYVISCFDCFTFQMWNLTIENIRLFDTVNCRFTFSDQFNYGEEFGDDIFTGNNQFAHQNNMLNRAALEKIFLQSNVSDYFFRQPKHKSCFASMQICRYSYFCTKCKELYCKFFEKDLHVFWS